MSTTPSPTPRSTTGATPQSPSGTAPVPSLTERRKAETRMEIARAAAALFVRQGLRATRAEDIAQRAGIAPRTFYRYFATKEEAVAPLYAAGAQRWAEAVRTAPARLTVPQALEHAVEHTLTPGAGVSAASWEWVRTLIRLTDTSPALRKVWAEVGQTSEEALAEILARRLATPGWGVPCAEETGGAPEGMGQVLEGACGASEGAGQVLEGASGAPEGAGEAPERVVVAPADDPSAREPGAAGADVTTPPGTPRPDAREAARAGHAGGPGVARASDGGGAGGVGGPLAGMPEAARAGESGTARDPLAGGAAADPLSPPAPAAPAPGAEAAEPPLGVPVITPDLRFAAAVAGSAVRVAVQSWAATTSPPAGPDGPAALALRNLRALGGFDWTARTETPHQG